MKYFSTMLCENIVLWETLWSHPYCEYDSWKTSWIVIYFLFSLTHGLNKLSHFFHFRLMINFLVTCVINNLFFGSLINETFSNLTLIVPIIGFIFSNKEAKQVVLIKINYNWISPTYKGDGGLSFVYSPRKFGEGGSFPPKKEEIGKMVETGCKEGVNYDCCFSLCL